MDWLASFGSSFGSVLTTGGELLKEWATMQWKSDAEALASLEAKSDAFAAACEDLTEKMDARRREFRAEIDAEKAKHPQGEPVR